MSILDDVQVLNPDIQHRYCRILREIQQESLHQLDQLSVPQWLLLASVMGTGPLDLVGSKPRDCEMAVRKHFGKLISYTEFEYNVINLLQTHGPIMSEGDDEDALHKALTDLVVELEEILPLVIEEGAALAFFKNREKIVSLLEGSEVEKFHTQFTNEDNIQALVDMLARNANWNTLAYRLKQGAMCYPKRKTRTITAFCDIITEYRLILLEEDQLSPILDQTGYDLPTKRKVENLTPHDLIDALTDKISDEIQEHFEGSLTLGELLIGCTGMVYQMGLENVCLIHHYSE